MAAYQDMAPLQGLDFSTTKLTPADYALLDSLTLPLPPGPLTGPGKNPLQQEVERSALRREVLRNMGPSALVGAAGFAAQAIPTAQDRYNNTALQALERGDATPQDKLIEQAQAQGQAGIANRAREARMRRQGQNAANTGSSAADVVRADREVERQIGQESAQLGQAGMTARLQEMGRKLEEADRRRAYKGERQGEIIDNGVQTATDIMKQYGRVRAGSSQPMLDISGMKTAGWSDDMIREAIRGHYSKAVA